MAFAEGDSASADVHPHMLASGGGFYYSKSNGYDRFFFKIRQKDVAVLNYIHSTLKLGHISRPSDGYYTYTVSARPEIMI